MANNYQIWDDGEMPGPVPENAKFSATPERLKGTQYDGYRVTAAINGTIRDCGWVPGNRVKSAEEAIAVIQNQEAARRKIYQ
jgi:hypothetical protein